MNALPAPARSYLRYSSVIPGIPLIAFPFWYQLMNGTIAIGSMALCIGLSIQHAKTIEKQYPEEVRPAELPIRSGEFNIKKWQLLGMLITYVAAGLIFKNLGVSIYSTCILVLVLALLIHEKLELDELRKKELTPATDRGGQ